MESVFVWTLSLLGGQAPRTDAEARRGHGLERRHAARPHERRDNRPSPEEWVHWGLKGRSHTKLRTLLMSQIPIHIPAEWTEDQLGFAEIDPVGHEGGNSTGEFCFTLTMTDICTGWTVNHLLMRQGRGLGARGHLRGREALPRMLSSASTRIVPSSSTRTSSRTPKPKDLLDVVAFGQRER